MPVRYQRVFISWTFPLCLNNKGLMQVQRYRVCVTYGQVPIAGLAGGYRSHRRIDEQSEKHFSTCLFDLFCIIVGA